MVVVDVVVGECVRFWGLDLVCDDFSDSVDLLKGKQNGLFTDSAAFIFWRLGILMLCVGVELWMILIEAICKHFLCVQLGYIVVVLVFV